MLMRLLVLLVLLFQLLLLMLRIDMMLMMILCILTIMYICCQLLIIYNCCQLVIMLEIPFSLLLRNTITSTRNTTKPPRPAVSSHLKDDCLPDATGMVVDGTRRPSLFGASGNTLKEYHSTPESASVHPNHITFRVADLYRDKHLGNNDTPVQEVNTVRN